MSKEILHPLSHEHNLTLDGVLRWRVEDGMVSSAEAEKLARNHKADRSHPLMVIAGQQWRAALPPGKLMTIEFLTEWLAARAGMPYFHIDPLQLNFGGIANIVSKSYAERLKIMPVKIWRREVTIATAEPFLTGWVGDIGRIS